MTDPVVLPMINSGMLGYAAAIVISGLCAYLKLGDMEKDTLTKAATAAIMAYFDPENDEVTTAPEGVTPETFIMTEERKAKLLEGKSEADRALIMKAIKEKESEGIGVYSIEYSVGVVFIEYGYIVDDVPTTGTFDPRDHIAEEAGYDRSGTWVRGLKMPDSRFDQMVAGFSLEDIKTLREQVDRSEREGLRTYTVNYSHGFRVIENGIAIGGSGGAKD